MSRYRTTAVWGAVRFPAVRNRARGLLGDVFTCKVSTASSLPRGLRETGPALQWEDKVPIDPYRRKRRRVNWAAPNPADAPLPTMGHRFSDETAEISKPQALSPIPRESRGEQRRIQRATSDASPAVLDDGSPSPSTTRPSTSAVDDRSALTPFIGVGPAPLRKQLGSGSVVLEEFKLHVFVPSGFSGHRRCPGR
jgi:hypothetical protein